MQLRKFCLPLQCVIRKRSFQESVFAQIMARGAVTVTASCNRKLTANKAECSLWLCLSTLQTSHMFLHTKDDTDSHGDMLHWPLRTSYFHTLHPLLPISYSYFLLKHHTELLYGHLLTITSVLATVRHSRQVSSVCRQSETDGAQTASQVPSATSPPVMRQRGSTMAGYAPTQFFFTFEYDATPIECRYTCYRWGTHATATRHRLYFD